jgi:hypothetical protein
MDDLILKLRNLQVLLEQAALKGSHEDIRRLVSEIAETADKIEKIRLEHEAENAVDRL